MLLLYCLLLLCAYNDDDDETYIDFSQVYNPSDKENNSHKGLCVPDDRLEDISFALNDDLIRLDDINVDKDVLTHYYYEEEDEFIHKPLSPPHKKGRGRGRGRGRKKLRFEKKEGIKCSHCQVEDTPQWRIGPLGRNTLCNACGLRYKAGKLIDNYRPVTSPTFDSAKHSNFYKRLLMRQNNIDDDASI